MAVGLTKVRWARRWTERLKRMREQNKHRQPLVSPEPTPTPTPEPTPPPTPAPAPTPSSMSLFDFATLVGLRQQEEAFLRDLERQARGLGVGLGLRGLGSSSVAAATQAAIAQQQAAGLANLRRQAVLDTLNLRQQALQQLGQWIMGLHGMAGSEAGLASQVGFQALGGAERITAGIMDLLARSTQGIGALQGYGSLPPLPETQPVQPNFSEWVAQIVGQLALPSIAESLRNLFKKKRPPMTTTVPIQGTDLQMQVPQLEIFGKRQGTSLLPKIELRI